MTRPRRLALAALLSTAVLLPTPAPAAPPCAEDEGVMWSDAGVTCFGWYPDRTTDPTDCPPVGDAWVTRDGECLPTPEPAPEPVDFPVELPRTT
jgi:hypothetical protein